MKKRIIIVLAAALIFCLFAAGCSSKDDPAVTEAPAVSPTPEPTPEPCVIMGKSYPLDTESVDLRGLNDTLVSETAAQLKRLTKLKTVTLGSWEESPVTWGKMNELHTACPQAAIDYEFSIYGKTFNLSDEEMDLKYVSIKDEGRLLKLITACMTNLTFLDMDTAGVSDEKMAELRDSLPNTEVVWRVWFGDYYSVRTNVERILASMPGKAGELTTESTRSLKYCTKVKYMDLGHNNFLDTIDFVSYMPDLEVLIVGMTFVEDSVTGGPVVSDDLSTSLSGVFACGNVLHVHDLVDFVSQEAAKAGENAAHYILSGQGETATVRLEGKNGVRYTVPQQLDPHHMADSVTVRFRVGRPYQKAALCVYTDGKLLRRVPKRILTPGEMEQFTLRREELPEGVRTVTFQIEEGEAK